MDGRQAGEHTVAQVLGQTAEELAARYLEGCGFRVLERNWTTRLGEVDLIVEKGSILAFVEVRFRSSVAFGTPEETVTKAKRRKVILAAFEYAGRRRLLDRRIIRFDVVAVVRARGEPRILHIEDAFEADLAGLAPPSFM